MGQEHLFPANITTKLVLKTPFQIRTATLEDAVALTDLAIRTMREAFGPPHNPAELVEAYIQEAFSVEQTRQELLDSQATFLVSISPEQEVVGYAKLRRNRPPRQLKGQHAIEIQRLYVLDSQIGNGLGRQLMENCLDRARREGYQVLWLGVWERNKRAIGFYERMGFQQCGWHYFQFGHERQRDYWMKKEVQ
ncbi:GNAT family N-acetyltransferase [Larkinella humicola]|uniref:GNAT family N-acetyltransferase n=1 Tax=Larkinella humicola TaxID=2607654 RepID=A0A5N1JAF6_9BACT|nr:GNAT family N-acetyltransferase [Larkinella humicola]